MGFRRFVSGGISASEAGEVLELLGAEAADEEAAGDVLQGLLTYVSGCSGQSDPWKDFV